MTGMKSIAAGAAHSIVLDSDGSVWAWGSNSSGQFGNNTTDSAMVAVRVRADASSWLSNVFAATVGGDHTAIVKNDGAVWTWGGNSKGQHGNNTTDSKLLPIQVYLTLFTSTQVTNISVSGTNDISTITSKDEKLQMIADIGPAYAANKNVMWSLTSTEVATISPTGVLTAVSNGTVTVKATARTVREFSGKWRLQSTSQFRLHQ